MNTKDKRLPNSELPYKHDIDIFINETCKNSLLWYNGGHCEKSCNE